MFKIKELFTANVGKEAATSDHSNELEIKNFIDQAWLLPGHLYYTTANRFELNTSLITTEYYNRDSSTSYGNCRTSHHSLIFDSKVLDIFCKENECISEVLLCIVLTSGEVKTFISKGKNEKCTPHVTAKLGNTSTNVLTSVMLSPNFSSVVWCEKKGSGAFDYSVYYQQVTFNFALNVSDNLTIVGTPLEILSNCPVITFSGLGSLTLCLPVFEKPANIFLLWYKEKLLLLNTKGTVLDKSKEPSTNLLDMLYSNIGKWELLRDSPTLPYANNNQEMLHILTKNLNILSLNGNGVVSKVIRLNMANDITNVLGFVSFATIFCLFTDKKLEVFQGNEGHHLQTIPLNSFEPVSRVWYCNSVVNMFGFISKNKLYRVSPLSASEILHHKNPETIMALYGNSEWEFLAKISSIVTNHPTTLSSNVMTTAALQSQALLLALKQHSRESTGSCQNIMNTSEENKFICSKLNKLLSPLVDNFLKLDEIRLKLIDI